jgi:hypothetical protein
MLNNNLYYVTLILIVVTFLKKSADYKKQKVKLNTRPYASYAGLSIFFNTTSTSLFTGGTFP